MIQLLDECVLKNFYLDHIHLFDPTSKACRGIAMLAPYKCRGAEAIGATHGASSQGKRAWCSGDCSHSTWSSEYCKGGVAECTVSILSQGSRAAPGRLQRPGSCQHSMGICKGRPVRCSAFRCVGEGSRAAHRRVQCAGLAHHSTI